MPALVVILVLVVAIGAATYSEMRARRVRKWRSDERMAAERDAGSSDYERQPAAETLAETIRRTPATRVRKPRVP